MTVATPTAAHRQPWRQILADVTVVTVTPFKGDRLELVDHAGLERNLEHVIRGGVGVLVAGGNTGEFAALSAAEVVEVVRILGRPSSSIPLQSISARGMDGPGR